MFPQSLPHQFQAALQLPAYRLRTGQFTEAGVADRQCGASRAGQIEGWCVRQVERFRTELEAPLLPEAEVLEDREIQVALPGPRSAMRAELPNVWIGTPLKFGTVTGTENAAGLKY